MVEALDRLTAEVLAKPATAAKLRDLGVAPRTRRGADLEKFVTAEIAKWNEVILKAKLPPQE
jgi:tripartite-type tricarboxylate transporter receptor subunit TctC